MYRNEITYTVEGRGGARYENQTILDRPRPLTARGAERILRSFARGDHPTARVSHVSAIKYA
jgi:hypothetical protein